MKKTKETFHKKEKLLSRVFHQSENNNGLRE